VALLDANIPGNFTVSTVRCVVQGVGELIPDVGSWMTRPTRPQLVHPVANQCPPPDLWVEVIFVVLLLLT
jgi:hypothetical protein